MPDQLPPFKNPWPHELPETPFYAYSEEILARLYAGFAAACLGDGFLAPLSIHFAMKSNNNPHVLKFFKSKGAGLDLVSSGELRLARELGFSPEHLVFSGVGKTRDELGQAVETGVALINVESQGELERLEAICRGGGRRARIAFRVNPDVDARTHPYISTGLSAHKFGVTFEDAWELYRRAAASPHFETRGVSVHIGSQMMDLSALDEALEKTVAFARRLRGAGIALKVLDVGGGLGVDYLSPLKAPPFEDYGQILKKYSRAWFELQGAGSRLYSECGRALVAQAGFLLGRVIGTKTNGDKEFAIVDASMTELLRPALYEAWHPIEALTAREGPSKVYEVVGPVCESSDVLGHERELPELSEGAVVAVGCAGAYGHVMSSAYNVRAIPAEWWCPSDGAPVLSRPRFERP